MRRAGVVAARREGKFIFYTLADEAVLGLLSALRRIAERNIAEVERVIRSYFNDRDSMEPISREVGKIARGRGHSPRCPPPDEFAMYVREFLQSGNRALFLHSIVERLLHGLRGSYWHSLWTRSREGEGWQLVRSL
jgi:hypothetical protein